MGTLSTEEILKGNELISIFKGYTVKYDSSWKITFVHNNDEKETILYELSNCQYHSSWDWLIPIVKELKKRIVKGIDYREWASWEEIFCKNIMQFDLNELFKSVVECIKAYNILNKNLQI